MYLTAGEQIWVKTPNTWQFFYMLESNPADPSTFIRTRFQAGAIANTRTAQGCTLYTANYTGWHGIVEVNMQSAVGLQPASRASPTRWTPSTLRDPTRARNATSRTRPRPVRNFLMEEACSASRATTVSTSNSYGKPAPAIVLEISDRGRAITHGAETIMSNTEIELKTKLRVEPGDEPAFEVEQRFRYPQTSMPSVGMRLSVRYDPARPRPHHDRPFGSRDDVRQHRRRVAPAHHPVTACGCPGSDGIGEGARRSDRRHGRPGTRAVRRRAAGRWIDSRARRRIRS